MLEVDVKEIHTTTSLVNVRVSSNLTMSISLSHLASEFYAKQMPTLRISASQQGEDRRSSPDGKHSLDYGGGQYLCVGFGVQR